MCIFPYVNEMGVTEVNITELSIISPATHELPYLDKALLGY